MDEQETRDPAPSGVKTYAKDRASAQDAGVLNDAGIELPGEPEALHAPDARPPAKAGTPGRTDSILSDKDNVFDVTGAFEGDAEGGMILRDTKRKKHSFFQTLGLAFKEWKEDAERSLKHTDLFKKKEKPTVTPARKREAVVREAGKFTRHVPQDDHTIVVEKLRTLEQDTEGATRRPFLIKKQKPAEERRGSWSHFVGNKQETPRTSAAPVQRETFTSEGEPHAIAPHVSERSAVPEHLERRPTHEAEPAAGKRTPRETEPAHQPEPVGVPQPEAAGHEPEKHERPAVARGREEGAQEPVLRPVGEPAEAPGPHATPETHGEAKDAPHAPAAPARAGVSAPEPEPEREKTSGTNERAAASRWSFFRDAGAPEEKEGEPVVVPSFEERERAAAFEVPTFQETAARKGRTYRGDAIDEIAEKKLTAPQIAARERSRPTTALTAAVAESSPNRLLAVILAGIVLLAGAGAAGFFLSRSSDAPTPSSAGIPAFMPVQHTVSVPMRSDREALLASIREEVVRAGTGLSHVSVELPGAGEESAPLAATTEDIFAVLDPRAPERFIRALDPRYMFGGYRQTETSPYLILKTTSFDVAFSGMLAWEPFIADDLGAFLGTSGSGSFTDVAVRNTSARVLSGAGGEAIVYAFVNRNTVVITTSTEALRVIEDAMR